MLIIDSPCLLQKKLLLEVNFRLCSPATREVIVNGPQGAEPLTVLLGIVAQLLIKFH